MDPIPQQFVDVSVASRAVEDEIECAVRSDANVLITGESRVGKDVVAHLIHRRSRRSRAALVTIHCAGISDTRLASELHVHVRGSFTDADRDKQGGIEQAHGRTLFLDDIGNLGVEGQSVLLGFLESTEIQPMGSDRRNASGQVRMITAARRRLYERVAAGEFREDLFYRLNVIHIEIPPLLDRRDAVPVLLQHFLRHFSAEQKKAIPSISDEALAQLETYARPGDVR
jgi:DNA-binding NtrC family response regulator